MRRTFLAALLLGLTCASGLAQGAVIQMQSPDGRPLPPGENIIGKVTAVTSNSLTVAPMMGGDPVTVKTDDNTRIMKDRQPAKLGDIKVDDTVFARGKMSGKVMDAAIVGVVNPAMMQQRIEMMGGPGGAGFNKEDLGKKFIVGEVKAINELKLTIARPDNQTQEIEVDENTSFKKGRESVTLADIKVGDFVRGPGELKNGIFVPKELNAGRPPGQMMMKQQISDPGQGAAGEAKKPDANKPPDNSPPKN